MSPPTRHPLIVFACASQTTPCARRHIAWRARLDLFTFRSGPRGSHLVAPRRVERQIMPALPLRITCRVLARGSLAPSRRVHSRECPARWCPFSACLRPRRVSFLVQRLHQLLLGGLEPALVPCDSSACLATASRGDDFFHRREKARPLVEFLDPTATSRAFSDQHRACSSRLCCLLSVSRAYEALFRTRACGLVSCRSHSWVSMRRHTVWLIGFLRESITCPSAFPPPRFSPLKP